ncbi:arginine--tRNA ligase [Microgenomates group bacterium RBG_16_45_19]|nr:MAG: arginine--tRNA ligase [Microgenomates group bacterium RBG_16_45_19]
MNPLKTEIIKQLHLSTALSVAEVERLLEVPPREELGDYAFPCFTLSKAWRKPPNVIAQELVAKTDTTSGAFSTAAAGPYQNFYLSKSKYVETVLKEVFIKQHDYGSNTSGQGKTIIIDYSSPNIAKPFGIGHLRSTVIGQSLYLIFKKLGHPVVRVNHLGDWGTQFGKLLVAYRKWGKEEEYQKNPVNYLYELYTRFHQEAESATQLEDQAREEFRKLELGEKENTKLWRKFREISLNEFKRIYDILGIEFDSYAGEAFYDSKIEVVLKELEENKLTEVSQEALVVNLDKFNLPPCLIKKKDEATLYTTRDLAAAMYRRQTYDFHKSLYVVGSAQQLHFQQVFKVLELMGHAWAKDCIHVDFGWVKFEEQILSTRSGHILLLEDVLRRSIQLVREIIAEKNPDLEEKEKVANQVGIGAVVFAFLSRRRQKDFDFKWEEVLNFEGESGPYLQYSHARLCSLQRKYSRPISSEVDFQKIAGREEYQLTKLLENFPETVKNAAEQYEPHIIANYLLKLAGVFNTYYQNVRIITEDETATKAKMLLVYVTQIVLREGLNLLGIKAPEKM